MPRMALLLALAMPALLGAQATLVGRVIDEAAKRPIPEVQVSIHTLSRATYTDSAGAFRMDGIAAGLQFVVFRKIGYEAITVSIPFGESGTVERTVTLSRVSVLDTVSVNETPWLREFDENRRLGLGKFLTPEDVERLNGSSIANRLSEFSGAGIVRGGGMAPNAAFLASSRGRSAAGIIWCPPAGGAYGNGSPPCGCYAQVYVDNMLMNPQVTWIDGGLVKRVTPPFDVNQLLTMSMYAVEWYAGSAQVPQRYSRPGSECGVLAIHMKRGR